MPRGGGRNELLSSVIDRFGWVPLSRAHPFPSLTQPPRLARSHRSVGKNCISNGTGGVNLPVCFGDLWFLECILVCNYRFSLSSAKPINRPLSWLRPPRDLRTEWALSMSTLGWRGCHSGSQWLAFSGRPVARKKYVDNSSEPAVLALYKLYPAHECTEVTDQVILRQPWHYASSVRATSQH